MLKISTQRIFLGAFSCSMLFYISNKYLKIDDSQKEKVKEINSLNFPKNKIEFESNKDPSPNPEMKIYSTFLKLMKTSSISENESGSEYSKEEEIKNENSKISSKSKFSVQKLKNVSFSNTWDFANIITTGIKKEEINKNEQ